jgi:hypothetical protein
LMGPNFLDDVLSHFDAQQPVDHITTPALHVY